MRTRALLFVFALVHGCTMNVTIVMPSPMMPPARGPHHTGDRGHRVDSPAQMQGVRHACGGATWYSDGSTGRTWAQARALCQGLGGDLASVRSADEQACAATTLQRAGAPAVGGWVGLHESQQEGAWRWSDDNGLGYSGWLAGEPNNDSGGPNDCGHLWRDQSYAWNDIPCTRTDPTFVCRL